MSGDYLGRALDTHANVTMAERLALIVMGDNAGHDGEIRGLTLDKIARITETDVVGARSIIQGLVTKGLVETTEHGLLLLLD